MGAGTIRIGDPGPRPAFPGPWAIPADILEEYRARRRGPFPRGANRPSLRNTWRFRHDGRRPTPGCHRRLTHGQAGRPHPARRVSRRPRSDR